MKQVIKSGLYILEDLKLSRDEDYTPYLWCIKWCMHSCIDRFDFCVVIIYVVIDE